MLKIFLSTHGKFASGIKNSLEILCGSNDRLTVFDAYVSDAVLEDALDAYLEEAGEEDQIVLVSDLFGGSVNNTMIRYLTRPNTYLLTGINLALVLELILMEEVSQESLDKLVFESREAMKQITAEELSGAGEKEEELFFE